MIRSTLFSACVAVSSLLAVPALAKSPPPPSEAMVRQAPPKIQIAILLDTSGSMDGLINQTREQLWRIVNTFAGANREGTKARLELALYQYGNDGIPSQEHYVKRMVPLTTDLDQVSEQLFKLTTNGGSEYCGAAISHALDELEWSSNPKDLKLLYVAGNEEFSQGPIDFRAAVKRAIGKGVVVNTLFAGDGSEGSRTGWLEAAKLADGRFAAVDQNRAIAHVDAPQDAQLAALSNKLNETYVGYGAAGEKAMRRQAAQDKNAASVSVGSVASRAKAKASAAYQNESWDLVDAKKAGKSVKDLPEAELPAEMKPMSPAKREAYVEEKSKERTELQAQIAKLSSERDAYIAKERAKAAGPATKSLDDALIETAREQATKADFSL